MRISHYQLTLSVKTEAAVIGLDEISVIPEPATFGLMGIAGPVLYGARRRR